MDIGHRARTITAVQNHWLKARLAFGVRGSVLNLARDRLELWTTFLGLCSASDRLRDLLVLEAG